MKDKFIQTIKNKWLRSTALTILLIAIVICAYIAIYFLIEKVDVDDIDLTKDKVYSISQETTDRLNKIDTDITIFVYNMSEYIKNFAYQYGRASDHIRVEEVENLTAKAQWKTEYGVSEENAFLVISTGTKEKILYDTDLYTWDYSDNSQIDTTEEAITNAILDVTTTVKPKIYFLTGHNLYAASYFQYFAQALEDEVNEIKQVDLVSKKEVPEDCGALVITALKEDIKEEERDRLITYIKKGGKILLLMDPNLNNIKFTNFQKVLDEYGISISNGIILEGNANKMVSGAPNFVISSISTDASITEGINMGINVCLINPAKLNIGSTEELTKKNVTVETLAVVSDKAFYRKDLQSSSQTRIDSDEDAGGSTVAAIMTKKIDDDTTSKLVVFTSTAFATNTPIQVGSQYYRYAIEFYNNKDVLLNSVSYLTERDENITIRKNIETVTYDVTELQHRIILGIIFTVPVVVIIVGIVIWIMRRRKK